MSTCTRVPLRGEVFRLTCHDWDFPQGTEVVCKGLFSCNSHWFCLVDHPSDINTVVITHKEWAALLELDGIKWMRMDFNYVAGIRRQSAV